MTLLADVKTTLRISSSNTVFDTEINDLIEAAKAELELSGVYDDFALATDPLIKRAITTYCKAHFGWDNPDSEKLHQSFEMLKNHLTLSGDYAFYKVTFTVTDKDTTDAVRLAEVTFNSQTKTTDKNGVAEFYVRKGNNYNYQVFATGYKPEIDLLDITANKSKSIELVG